MGNSMDDKFLKFIAFAAFMEEEEEEQRKGTEEYMDEKLEEAGLDRYDLEMMDEEERAWELECAGLDPFEYEIFFDSQPDSDWLEDEYDHTADSEIMSAIQTEKEVVNTSVHQKKPASDNKEKKVQESRSTEEIRLKSIPMPAEPEYKMETNEKIFMGFGIICLFAALIWTIAGEPVYIVIEAVAGIWAINVALKQKKSKYNEKLADYELAKRDFPAYQRKMLAKQEKMTLNQKYRRMR